MSSLDTSVIASLDKNGMHFEIIVDSKKVYDYLENKKKDSVQSLLVSYDIYKDARKGERVNDDTLKKVFGTIDTFAIAEKILNEGEVQITTEQRRKMVEEKRKKIIALIARMATDAQTNLPIPPMRIELAMEKIRLNIDPFKDAESQLEGIISQLRLHLPIKIEKKAFAIKVPAAYAYKVYGFIKEYNPEKIEYDTHGNLFAKLTLFAGVKAEFLEALANRTAGNVEVKEL